MIHILGIGYRPVEYELHGVDFHRRGAIADEKLAVSSSTSAPPETTHRPVADHARRRSPRADRWSCGAAPPRRPPPAPGATGSGFIAQSGDPALGPAYEEAARAAGHEPGLCVLPSPDSPASVFVADDVDAGWREVGEALLADATAY